MSKPSRYPSGVGYSLQMMSIIFWRRSSFTLSSSPRPRPHRTHAREELLQGALCTGPVPPEQTGLCGLLRIPRPRTRVKKGQGPVPWVWWELRPYERSRCGEQEEVVATLWAVLCPPHRDSYGRTADTPAQCFNSANLSATLEVG
jgi:hypothetical protein